MSKNLTVIPTANGAMGTDDSVCQLRAMPDAALELSRADRAGDRLGKALRLFARRAMKVAADPMIVWRKAAARIRADDGPAGAGPQGAVAARHAAALKPGELVRVRSLAEIEAMLDANGRTGGLAFLPVVMAQHCGRTFAVRKRVDRFFDERNWRMMKLRDVVLLDGSHCEPARDAGVPWAGCERSCFLFWKEAWLERVAHTD